MHKIVTVIFFLFVLHGVFKASAINLDSLLQVAENTSNIQEKIDAYNKLGWEFRINDNSNSKKYLLESFRLLSRNDYKKGRAQALNNYGCAIMLVGEFKEAEDSLNKSFELYKELNFNEEAGKTLTNIGSIYFYRGKVKEAISYCENALNYFKKFPEKEAMTNVNLGVMYRTIGDYELAIKKQLSALDYFKSIKDTSNQVTSLNNIGSLYLFFKQYDKSLDYHEQALKLATNFPQGKASALGSIGNVCLKLKMYDKAYDYYYKALELFFFLGLEKEMASTKYNLGDVLFKKKDYDNALERVTQAEISFNKLGLNREKVTAINLIGLIYFELNQNDSALLYLQQALDLQKHIEDPIIYQSTLRNLAKLYEMKGDHAKANNLYNIYNESKDSIFSIIAAEKVAESEAKFRLKEKEQLLSETKDINKTLSGKLKYYGLLLIISLIFIAFILFFYLKKRKEALFIKSQKEDILKKYNSLEDAYANMYNALEKFQHGTQTGKEQRSLPEWVSELSKRELEVLSCLAVGMTDKEISDKLFVSLTTVRTHCRRIYSKLLVKNRSEAASFAREYGLI